MPTGAGTNPKMTAATPAVGGCGSTKLHFIKNRLAAQVSVVHGSGGGGEGPGDVGDHPPKFRMPILPFKLNQDRRHHIPRQQRKVTNWLAYDASLRQPAPARQLDGVVY